MRQVFTVLGFVIALVLSNAVMAATFNFSSYADTDADGDGHNEWGYRTFSVTEDGVSLRARGYHWKHGWKRDYAYLDAGNAGLGVCKKLTAGKQCNPGKDDSVQYKEMLQLSFDQTVELDQVVFINGSHGTNFAGHAKLLVGTMLDGVWSGWTKYSLTHLFTADLIGDSFFFYNPNKYAYKYTTKQFYIDSISVTAVPVPAAIWLFGSAMIGLVGMRRKNKFAA